MPPRKVRSTQQAARLALRGRVWRGAGKRRRRDTGEEALSDWNSDLASADNSSAAEDEEPRVFGSAMAGGAAERLEAIRARIRARESELAEPGRVHADSKAKKASRVTGSASSSSGSALATNTTAKAAAKRLPKDASSGDKGWKRFPALEPKKGWTEEVCRREPPVVRIRHGTSSGAASSSRARTPTAPKCSLAMRVKKIHQLGEYSKANPALRLADPAKRFTSSCHYPPSSVICEVRHLPPGLPADVTKGQPNVLPPFKVPSNVGDAQALQPPHFKKFPLRPEQLRSLGWMLERESNADSFEVEWRSFWVDPEKCSPADRLQLNGGPDYGCFNSDTDGSESSCSDGMMSDDDGFGGAFGFGQGFGFNGRFRNRAPYRGHHRHSRNRPAKKARKAPPYTVDLRFRANFPVRGGILADKIGYGKTASTIGLMNQRLDEPDPPIPAWDQKSFIPIKATLILVPGNLLEQWLGEISKFTGDGSNLKNHMNKGWIDKASYKGAFNIFACTNVTPLKAATVEKLMQADVVICTYRLLFSEIYRERLLKLSCANRTRYSMWASGFPGQPFDASSNTDIKFDDPLPASVRRGSLACLREMTKRLLAGKAQVPSADHEDRHSRIPHAVQLQLARDARAGDKSAAAALKGSASNGQGAFVRKAADLRFPVLEMFHWRRVVFDEFHELEAFPADQQTSLQHFRSHYRWGLTGTPPLDTVSGTIFMSSLFRVDLTGTDSPNHRGWDSDRLLMESAGRFLDFTTRQNTAEISDIRLEEHLVPIRHSARERALYVAQSRDAGVCAGSFDLDEGLEEDKFDAYTKLLKLCSHFQSGAAPKGGVTNAAEECKRIFELKERRFIEARNRVGRGLKALSILEHMLPQRPNAAQSPWRKVLANASAGMDSDTDKHAKEAVQYLASEELRTREFDIDELPAELDGFRPNEGELKELLGHVPPKQGMKNAWAALLRKRLSRETLTRLLQGQAEETVTSLRDMRETSASLEFFQQTLRVCQDNADADSRACVVCLASDLPLSRLAITPCSHVFCLKCLNECVRRFKRCSLCNSPLTNKDVAPLALELAASQQPASASSSASSSTASSSHEKPPPTPKKTPRQEYGRYGKYGTKLGAIVEKLHEIRRDDPTAKVIVYTQFDDLKLKVAEALEEFGVPMAKLHGSPAQRDKVIREWQNDESAKQFVLLLSLEQSASGTNLTAGNHVILVHPMLAATQERAVSFEMQAIGRVRRHGQLRDVHVWRFVTLDTLEEELTRRHQAELLERDRGTIAGTASKPKAVTKAKAKAKAKAKGKVAPKKSPNKRK